MHGGITRLKILIAGDENAIPESYLNGRYGLATRLSISSIITCAMKTMILA
jgi:hypothetical protein